MKPQRERERKMKKENFIIGIEIERLNRVQSGITTFVCNKTVQILKFVDKFKFKKFAENFKQKFGFIFKNTEFERN